VLPIRSEEEEDACAAGGAGVAFTRAFVSFAGLLCPHRVAAMVEALLVGVEFFGGTWQLLCLRFPSCVLACSSCRLAGSPRYAAPSIQLARLAVYT
jgi:hypothetical protein